jgi:hypothetical protein
MTKKGSREDTVTIRDVVDTLRLAANILQNERATLDDFHAYAEKFGEANNPDAYLFVLTDALRLRGLTLEEFRESRKKGEKVQ